jgi:hypothetical protein
LIRYLTTLIFLLGAVAAPVALRARGGDRHKLAPPAAPPPLPDQPADISPVKDRLRVLTDGKNHYLALIPFGPAEHLYYGDGKSFYAQRVIGSSRVGQESFQLTFWEPRATAPYEASLQLRDQTYRLQCEERITPLRLLPEAEGKAIIDAARFSTPRWKHQAHALARDDRGVYYYVDQLRDPESSKSFRIYAGPKGSMKPLAMLNVVSDSQGEIFSTAAGDLRLVLDRKETFWIKNRRRTPLLSLPVDENRGLIYTDLGVYTGQRLGTPCDDL